jgi:hypothetical protein
MRKSRKNNSKKRAKKGGSKSRKISSFSKSRIQPIPLLVESYDNDIIHEHLNLLIELMGSSLYDTFIDNLNHSHNLNIQLIPCKTNLKNEAFTYAVNNNLPAIFYGSGKEYTHFICTYNKSFELCKNKINTISTLQTNRRSRNPCKYLQNCLWDSYENGGDDCTIYAGFQKNQAHSFCQTFALSCIINQYLPDFELVYDFKLMKSTHNDPNNQNEILIMNAFYAKNIACKIIRYVFDNNLSSKEGYHFWDFLHDQLVNNYLTNPPVNENNYIPFMNRFLEYCDNITIDQLKNSTFIPNVIY